MKLVVTEIFHSLQGEGPSIGTPSVFVRLGGCIEPLCPWCDTPYAWHDFEEMDLEEIARRVASFGCRDVVITGGEPFLQWDVGLADLHASLRSSGFRIHYETSGKAGIPSIDDAVVVASPKHIDGAWHIRRPDLANAHWFKFVADGEHSLRAIRSFVSENAIDPEKVYVMPMGATRAQQMERMRPVFLFCRDNGLKMSPRLQVLVFDDERGV
ncbi:MAG TPA: 7-carboxy-7-deazaguanine synthase QueE [Deltaproteobacteria bacterium]|nr:7-carboxy-7-deazaguanine synthase QueE [Deltaproteobacteria bacterium]HOM29426.1 7-carboxy-7-deazaguanine synthase QueE [Deltaproteobacteria bacterium]HPP81852.1 7-carboxy-7-deazaguanine synthase QueE [Deltaproteobacteria bacterium]